MHALLRSAFLSALVTSAATAQEPAPPVDGEAVDRRGDHAMGFSHQKADHHFGLTPEGGFISAEAHDAGDADSAAAIRGHFQHIAGAFKQGHFDMPMFIHGKVPPGVPVLKRKRAQIDYRVEPTLRGARVVITTADPKAIAALHAFLRFQIVEHRTGDSSEVATPSTSPRAARTATPPAQ